MAGEWQYTFDEYLDDLRDLLSFQSLYHNMSIKQQIETEQKIENLKNEIWKLFPEECETYDGPINIS